MPTALVQVVRCNPQFSPLQDQKKETLSKHKSVAYRASILLRTLSGGHG